MELPFVGQVLQVTIPKHSKIAPNSKRPSFELERKESCKRASSSNPREKEGNEEQKAEGKTDELEEKIQSQNHEILQNKKYKEKSEGRKPAPGNQNTNNLTFLLRHGDIKEKGVFQDINLVKCFGGSKVCYFWKLWEIVLTNQPLLIVSDSPTKCR